MNFKDRAEVTWLILKNFGRAAFNIRTCDYAFTLCKHWKDIKSGVLKIVFNDWSCHF